MTARAKAITYGLLLVLAFAAAKNQTVEAGLVDDVELRVPCASVNTLI